MAKTAFGAENIFNISNPQGYRCQLLHYHNRLSRLYIEVYQGQEKIPVFYLLFSDVGYVDAPTSWYGANFCIASKDECINLMIERGLIGEAVLQFPNAYAPVTEYARLYWLALPKTSIRIIGSSASMLQSIPDEVK